MKSLLQLSALFVLGALSAARLFAGIEPFKIEPTYVPRLSPVMEMEGITEGRLVVVIDVDETGKLTDTLVLGYTHRGLVRPCIEALKQWKITPARLDGKAVAAQAQLTINYSAEGVVISRTTMEDIDNRMQRAFGYRLETTAVSPNRLDAALKPLSQPTPLYAAEAEKQGVRGTVNVYFYVDETGAVRMPSVNADAHPYLSDAAVTAVRSWKFQPPTADGRPVMIAARQDFQFGK